MDQIGSCDVGWVCGVGWVCAVYCPTQRRFSNGNNSLGTGSTRKMHERW